MKCWSGWSKSWNQDCRRNINNLRYADVTTLMAESELEPLDEGERGKWKSWLKTQLSKNKYHVIWFHHLMTNRRGKRWTVRDFNFLWLQNHCGWWLQPWNEKILIYWKKSYDNPRQHIKKQRHHFANKGPHSQSYGFSSSHVWMWELDYKESWMPKNWCFWIVVLKKTLESPLDCKEIQPVNSKGNQSWIFIGRLMLKLKLQYFGHLMRRTDSLEKTLMLGKTEGKRIRGGRG